VTAPRPVIAVDWGTSSFRAYALGPDGATQDHRASESGILRVAGGDFATAFRQQIGDWLDERPDALVVMSGMIGSRQGWMEVPYCPCPCDLSMLAAGLKRLDWPDSAHWPGVEVWVVPGLSAETAPGLPDVMRGEEMQIFGALPDLSAEGSGERAVVCLPGTHSKWASVAGGAVTGFATYMTGEVYDVLQGHSILGRLMTAEPAAADAWFEQGVALGAEGALLRVLFSARSRVLSGTLPESAVRSYLSGLLIGHEVSAALCDLEYPPAQIALLGAPALEALYEVALRNLGCDVKRLDAEVAAQGLFQVARRLLDGDTIARMR